MFTIPTEPTAHIIFMTFVGLLVSPLAIAILIWLAEVIRAFFNRRETKEK